MHFVFLMFLLAGVAAHASPTPESQPGYSPLWELGMGAGLVNAPDYPGSDHSSFWVLPFPFGVYRGEILHSDRRGGTRARLLRSASWEFNVSAAGGLPSSSHSTAREGMPDLEWLGEIGPRLMIDLWSDMPGGRYLRLGIPFRAALSANGHHLVDRGFRFAPELLYDHPRLWRSLDGYIHLTFDFSDTRFANYFYGVHPDYARPDRPAYTAKRGYIQADLTGGFMVPVSDWGLRIFTFAGVQSLDGATNRASPLFKTTLNTSLSVVFLWVFAESKTNVQTED